MADEDERRRTQQIAIVTILEAKTHYQVLSLSSTASQDEIRNSYIYVPFSFSFNFHFYSFHFIHLNFFFFSIKLSRLVHPDKW